MARTRLDKPVTAILLFIHLAALSAVWVAPTRTAIALLLIFFFAAGLGITIGFHRLLSHRAFECSRFQRCLWATLGTTALQGGPMFWVGLHRKHHQYSDRKGDPHSPRESLLEGHMLWMTRLETKSAAVLAALAWKDLRELGRDPYLKRLDPGLGPLVPWLVTLILCGAIGGLPGLVWGGLVRTVIGWHATWLVNSVGHRWGRRPHPTRDNSQNVWWLAPIAFGDQWHNNHHAHPRAAILQERWWQFDLSGTIIVLLERIGWVRAVVRAGEGVTFETDKESIRA